MLRQVAGETAQGIDQHAQALDRRIRRIETGLGERLRGHGAVASPGGDRGHERLDLLEAETECLADITHRAAGPVGDHGRGQGRTVAAVLPVDVLDDLFAAPVLEIDVDVRRLVALPGDEALEQQVHPGRVDLGDAEAIADRGVGGGAASLAQDALPAGVAHDVPDGQEIGLVTQLRDQCEFVLDLCAHRVRTTRRPAPRDALFGQPAQIGVRRRAGRCHVVRVFVAQFVEREPATPGDLQRLGQQVGRIQGGEIVERPQVAFTVQQPRLAQRRDRRVPADRRQQVLHDAPATAVHVHLTGPDPGQPGVLRQPRTVLQTLRIPAVAEQRDRQPGAPGKLPAQPGHGGLVGRRVPWQQDQTVGQVLLEVPARETVASLVGIAPCAGDQPAQLGIAAAVARQQHQARPVRQCEFAADDQPQTE